VEDEGKSYIFVRIQDAHAHEEEVKQAEVAQHAEEEEHEHDGHGEAEEGHGTSFQRVQVVTGEKDQGFVQIKQMPDLPSEAEVVTQGAYFLFSEMKKGEGMHHHH
jgi:cobalt-zinc-cadmium efflux system membrane fusion protein